MKDRIPDSKPGPATPLRVAVLIFGGPEFIELLDAAGLRIAYLYDDSQGTEYLTFEDMPEFDLIAASLPGEVGVQERAFGLTLRFLRERKPVSFMMVGPDISENRMAKFLENEARELGYKTNTGQEHGGPTYMIGTQPQIEFVWPSGVLPRTAPTSRQEQQEGLEDEPQSRIPGLTPAIGAVPVMAFGGGSGESVTAMMAAVIRAWMEAFS